MKRRGLCGHQSRLSAPLPRWIGELLAHPPLEGTGFHRWLFRAACALKPYRSDVYVINVLAETSTQIRRSTAEGERRREVIEAVRAASNPPRHPLAASTGPSKVRGAPGLFPGRTAGTRVMATRWPGFDARKLAEVVEKGETVASLAAASPFEMSALRCEDVIDAIFPPEALLCCGRGVREMETRKRDEWEGRFGSMQFIVPSPMSSVWGRTRGGKESQRTLDNTGPRRFLVVECDFRTDEPGIARFIERGLSTFDLGASVIGRLARTAPLVMAVRSGGKSLHGWFFCEGQPEDVLRAFFGEAVSLGADPMMWTLCQPARMPGGVRDNGVRQAVQFYNPNILIEK